MLEMDWPSWRASELRNGRFRRAAATPLSHISLTVEARVQHRRRQTGAVLMTFALVLDVQLYGCRSDEDLSLRRAGSVSSYTCLEEGDARSLATTPTTRL